MKTRVLTPAAIGLAALLGALGTGASWGAGMKSSGTVVIVDDLTTGAAGMVHATTAGGSELDGGLGQVADLVEAALAAGTTVEAGYLSRLTAPPSSPVYVRVNGSSATFQWADAATPNPSGTTYAVDMSTDPLFGGTLISSSGFAFTGTVAGLRGNATYYARVRASYLDGDDSSEVAVGQSVTRAMTPNAGLIYDDSPFALRTLWDPLSNSPAEMAGPWSVLGATLPAIRQGHAMVAYGGRLYVAGGLDTAPQNTVWTAPIQADGSIGTWTAVSPMPGIRESHSMAAWGGCLYVAGGSDGTARATVWWAPIRSDGTLGDWTATTALPSARVKFSMVAWGGELYVAGGNNIDDVPQSTFYYAPINDDGSVGAWTTGPALPLTVSGLAMAVSSGTLYVSGGLAGGVVDSVWWSSLSGAGVPGSWNTTTSLPVGLTRHAMAAANGKLYVLGGNDGTVGQAATWASDLNADGTVAGWVPGPALPAAVSRHALAATSDRLYISGGSNGISSLASIASVPLSGTQYLTELAGNAGFSVNYASSGWRSGAMFEFAGLTPNSAYFTRVTARGNSGAQTGTLAIGSTVTLAAMPSTAVSTFTDVEIGSITVQWALGSDPAGTQFLAQLSTAPDFSGSLLQNDWTVAVSTGFTSLSVNTSYYLRVQARNSLQVVSPYSLLGSTYTLAVPPTGSTITASNASGLTLVWANGGNPPGTFYEAQVAGAPAFSAILQSSVTLSTSAVFSGLTSANTFYARVRAINGNRVPSSFDAVVSTSTGFDVVPPAVATGTFAIQSGAADAITAGWVVPGDNGNSGTLVAGAKFYVQWSTSDPSTVAWDWTSAQVVVTTGPLAPGAVAATTISGLPDQHQVYFREWTRDQAGNFSPPSSTFTAFSSAFSFEALDGGGGFNAGSSPSIAVDKSGNLHVAYLGTTGTQSLHYIKRTAGVWGAAQDLDPTVVASNLVLALDASDNPVIAYTDTQTPQLKLARFNGSWSLGVIETGSDAAGGVAVDAASGINVSYYDAAGGHLKFGRWTGAWSTQTVDASGADTGRESALALDAAQQPHIAYYDATNHALKYASATAPGVWSLQTIDSGVNVGTACVIALDGGMRAHVAYGDAANHLVKYASETASGWLTRTVEPSGNVGGLRLGLALDGAGSAAVSYSDRAAATVKFARWAGTSFSTQTIDSSGDEGLESTLGLDGSGGVHIAYRDATSKSLKVAHWTGAGLTPPFGGGARGRVQAPSAMSATVLSTTGIQWSWTDNASDEMGFRVYGALVSTGPFTLIAGTETITASAGTGGIKSYVESGLTVGTTYYRYAVAVGTGGVAAAATTSAFPYNTSDLTPPTFVNNQAGDDVWRHANNGLYRVSVFDTGGSHLSKFQVKASTMPGGVGPDLIAYTDAITGIGSDSYITPWPLPTAVFNAMRSGATNYVTILALDAAGNAAVLTDAFYVRKDTDAPIFTNAQASDAVPHISTPAAAAVFVADSLSGLAGFQYSVSTTAGAGDAAVIAWTDIAAIAPGATSYSTPWSPSFPSLFAGATNYVSVRAWDVAGSTRVLTDAFSLVRVLGGPAVTISAPASSFMSAVSTITGAAADAFGVGGVELNVQENPPAGLYWSGTGFNSPSPVWLAASGTVSWSFVSASLPWVDRSSYSIVVRSTDSGGNYSSVYATATFMFDATAPTAGVLSPASGVTVSSLTTISGTAADPGGTAAAGVSVVELRLKRLSDGLWWNFVTQAWSTLAVSTTATGTTAWTFHPSAILLANLSDATSYYLAVRADDNASPSNAGNFFTSGSSTFTFADTVPPGTVSDLAGVAASTTGAIALTWSAPGENGANGIILSGQYRIQYATFSTVAYSTSAAQVVFATGTVVPGSAQSRTVTGLVPGSTYYLGLWTLNTAGNWSALSNLATAYAEPGTGNQISGHVIEVSSQGITAVELDAFDASGSLQGVAFTQADGSGTYVLNGLPSAGSYKIQATWSANGVASSVWIDGIAVGATGLDFVLQLNYNLATLTGTLNTLSTLGTVGTTSLRPGHGVAFFNPKAAPAADRPRIELYQNNRQVGMVLPQSGGHWRIPNLLPGRYSVRSYNGLTYTDFQTVDLVDGETKTMTFVYDPLPKDQVYAFPSPARTSTTLRFLSTLAPIEKQIRIFDVAGNLVKEISDSDIQAAPGSGFGVYHAAWDLTNSRGEGVASGVYLFAVKVKGGDNQSALVIKKMAVVK